MSKTASSSVPLPPVRWAEALETVLERSRAYLAAAKTWLSTGGIREDEDTPPAVAMRSALQAMNAATAEAVSAQKAAERINKKGLRRTPELLALFGRIGKALAQTPALAAEVQRTRTAIIAERN